MKIDVSKRVLVCGLALVSALFSGIQAAAEGGAQQGDLGVCPAPRSLPVARAEARRLVDQIRVDLAPVENQIRNVPFLASVEAGTASLEQIAAVAAEQYSIIRSDWSSFLQMTARFDDPASRQLFGGIASGEALALPLLFDFATSVGLDERDLAAYEPRPKGRATPRAWRGSPPTPIAPRPVHRSWSTLRFLARTWAG
ncbi:MAG: hypothetical protein HC897_17250 [Thermoanaerobaculia bacterium]|nr:hypothetical protein [Thermoanaerobaculia bacterium]